MSYVRRPESLVGLALCLSLCGPLACANRGMQIPSDDGLGGVGSGGDTEVVDAAQDGPLGSGGAGGLSATGDSGAGGSGGTDAGGFGGAASGGNGAGGVGGMSTGGAGGHANTGGAAGAGTAGAGGSSTGGAGGHANSGGAAGAGLGGLGGAGMGGAGAGGNVGGAAGVNSGGAGGQTLPSPFAYYPFEQTSGPMIQDASGHGHIGTLVGTATFPAGVIGTGLSLPGGSGDYVALPSALLQTVTDVTIALWVDVRTDQSWQRVFDFGSSQNVYMFLTPHAGGTTVARFAISINGNAPNAEQRLDAPDELPLGTWTHVAIVLGSNGGTLYINGASVATNADLTLRPADLGATLNDWLGQSQFTADPAFDGTIDDLRIYDSALTADQIATIYSSR